MNNIFKTCSFSKEDNPGKSFIQSLLYKQSKVRGKATIVSGPAIERHLKDATKYIQKNNSSIDIVEIDSNVLVQIINNYSELTEKYQNVKFILSDISKLEVLGRFVDADLTSSIKNSFNIFKTVFNKMYNHKTKFYQNLICTYSLRDKDNISISKFLIDLGIARTTSDVKLKSRLDLPTLGLFPNEYYSVRSYQNISKDNVKFKVCTVVYNSGNGPMCSVSIQW